MTIFLKHKKAFISGIILLLLGALAIAAVILNRSDECEKIIFEHNWQWIAGENDGLIPGTLLSGEGFHPLDEEREQQLSLYCPGSTGYIWVRTTFTLPEELKNTHNGIFSKRILFAGDIYINGQLIGSLGKVPPKEFMAGYKSGCFDIPDALLNKDSTNVLAIKIWVEGMGSIPQLIYLSEYEHASRQASKATFFCSTINFSFSFSLILITLLYLFLYAQRNIKEYLYHGLLNTFSAFFLVPFFQDQFDFIRLLCPDYLLFCKLFSAIPAYITTYFASSYMREFLKEKDSSSMRYIRLLILLVPIVITLFIPDIMTLTSAQPVLILFIGFQLYFGVESIFKAILNKKKEVYILIAGFMPVLVAIPADIIIHMFPSNINIPFITIFGWQGVILAFIFILSTRFSETFRSYESLQKNLEKEIENRTIRLSETNKHLEEEMNVINEEMKFAVHVQESFFKPPVLRSDSWDLATKAQATAYITGDFFDIYHVGNVLEGLALFDVSGHGVAAGLVTMFCKDIVQKNFKNGLYSGNSHEDLGDVLENIHRDIIVSKGDIENYLAGVILRVDNAPAGEISHAELANAANPFPILYHGDTGKCTEIKVDKPTSQFGMIGIRGMEGSFPPVKFDIAPGDALILYTDGVNEAENPSGKAFGSAGIINALESSKEPTAAGKVNAIYTELINFRGSPKLKDDITIVVLQRKKAALEEFPMRSFL